MTTPKKKPRVRRRPAHVAPAKPAKPAEAPRSPTNLPPLLAQVRDETALAILSDEIRRGRFFLWPTWGVTYPLSPMTSPLVHAVVQERYVGLVRALDDDLKAGGESLRKQLEDTCTCGRPWCRHALLVGYCIARAFEAGYVNDPIDAQAREVSRLEDFFARRC